MSFRRIIVVVLVAAVFLAVPVIAEAVPDIPSSAFEPFENCGCHSALQVQWSRSMHAQALTDPIYLHELELALEATDGAIGPFCHGCHAPIATMAGEITGLETDGLPAQSKQGIQCDFCHQVTGREGERPGNSSYALASPDGTKRAQFDDAKSPYHETAYSAFHESAEFCGNCHDVYHPVNGLQLEATYTEWKNGPFAAQGIVCQDCHMTPGPGVTKPNPGRAAGFGLDREHIYIMTFAGGNTALGDAVLAEERLQAAAEVTIEAPEYVEPGATGEVEVTVANVGAGHYIPTGLTELRQMWLEVVAVDDAGEGELIGEHRYGTILADDAGNQPVPLWEASTIASDDRIPPQESRSYTYELVMNDGGVADVQATLYYRSVSEEIAEEAHVEVPTTTMATATQVVYGSADDAADAARDTMGGDGMGNGGLVIAIVGLVVALGIIVIAALRSRNKETEEA